MRNFLSWASGGRAGGQRRSASSNGGGSAVTTVAATTAAQDPRGGGGQPASRRGTGGSRLTAGLRLRARGSASNSSNAASRFGGGTVFAKDDPLRLDAGLFEYVTHRSEHGEVFVAYRLLGHPMVLHSLVDGLPLASLHLRAVPGRGSGSSKGASALVARRPGKGDDEFLGIITADNQDFELVMTNLTTDAVMMFDIGGVARTRESMYWDRNDASFWSGRHRNDRRLNRSNILWPMTPNVCSENNFHFQDHGEHRRLVLRAKAPIEGGGSASSTCPPNGTSDAEAGCEDGFRLFVYPKHGSRTAEKFARTAWSCPQTILVLGTPALLDGDFREGHTILVERPTPAPSAAPQQPRNLVDEVASSFGVSAQRLLEVVKIDVAFLENLPRALQLEAMHAALESADLSALEDEPPAAAPAPPHSSSSASMSPPTSSGADGEPERGLELGARPAEVAAGRRLLREGAHSLLVERFDFDRRGGDAVLTLGVRDGVQLCEPAEATAQQEAKEAVVAQLERLVQTRAAELKEDMQKNATYDTTECVVCMEPGPDTVLYQCGHRCVHFKCVESARLRRCPLCRSPIVALLPPPDLGGGPPFDGTASGSVSSIRSEVEL